jgi:threonine dehydrogenase-like Zn-dependent dehydrogenase
LQRDACLQNTQMKAIQFDVSVPRYVLGKALGTLYKPFFWSGLSCLRYGDVAEPALPGPDWVKIETHYGGICGSDWGLIHLHDSPYLSPFSSDRFIVGHENLGTITEVGSQITGWSLGERVIADLMLPCAVRGYADPCPACRRGDYNLCSRFAEGALSPGTLLGSCADTGGSWGPVYVAHQSQLVRVPDNVSDENAILLDGFCSALHPILRHFPEDDETVLILGAGTIGLCAIASLRALGSQARVLVLAKYPFQGELARHYGADEVVYWGRDQDHYPALAELTGAKIYHPILGKPALVGGANIVYACVGNSSSVDDALRLTGAGGKVVLVGLVGVPKGVDCTPIWFHELTVVGSYAVAMETYQGRRMRTYEVGLELMAQGKLDLTPLLTHKYRLAEYRQAFRTLSTKGVSRALKAVFTYE